MTPGHSIRQIEVNLVPAESASDHVYVMPTSLAQQRFWILDQLEPGNASLNMPLALRLTGSLDTATLERALNEIVSRHEILRTTFSNDNGKPVQVIAARRSLDLQVIDLCGRLDQEDEANRLMVDEAHHSFDLSRGPLFKAKLISLAAEDHILLLTLHHIICDGWSNGILVREIGEIYDAFSKGLPSPYCELPIQYADFAAWEQERLNNDAFRDQLKYWSDQLGNALPTLDIPTDFARNGKRGSFGAIESLLLPQPFTRAVRALAKREQVTPFVIFLAAFNVLLHRYTGQDEILIGSPTANRSQGETEGLIGPFANTLLLKSDLSGSPTFKELLERTKDVSLGAFSNQTVPFEKLIGKIRPTKNGGRRGQLFQVMFIFQTAFMQPVELEELSITPIRSVSPGSIFELSLGVVERLEGIRLQLEYNTDLFKIETVKFMLEDLQTILQMAVLDMERKVSDLLTWTTPLRFQEGETSDGRIAAAVSHRINEISGVSDNEQVERELTSIWRDVLHLDSVGTDADFFEVGGHSLLAAQLFSEIAKRLKVNLPLSTLFSASTIEQLANVVRQEMPKDVWTSLVPVNVGGTRPPLFLTHAAGGNVLFYKDLARHLGNNQPLFALQSRGLYGDQSVQTSVENLAEHYVQEIRSVQPAGPYFLGGMCFGAYVALEIAQRLRSQGQDVARLIVFDSGAPRTSDLPKKQNKPIGYYVGKSWRSVLSADFARKFSGWCAERKIARRISDHVRLRRARGIAGPDVQRDHALERAHRIAAVKYVASAYDGHITLIRSEEFSMMQRKDGHMRWRELALGGFDHFTLNGTHLELLKEPTVGAVAERLKTCLDDAIAEYQFTSSASEKVESLNR